MRTSFHHQSEAQPPNGPLTAVTSPDTPSAAPANPVGIRLITRRACKSQSDHLCHFLDGSGRSTIVMQIQHQN
jgi:hypothetical protein